MDASDECPSHYRLDRCDAGELSPAESAQLHEHIAGCARCVYRIQARARAAEDHREDSELIARLSTPVRMNRATPVPRRATRWAVAGLSVAAAAAVMFVLPQPREETESAGDGIRLKGTGFSRMHLIDDHGEYVASTTERVHPGTQLQVTVHAPRRTHAAVVSIDGADQGSVYVPYTSQRQPAAMVEVPAGAEFSLPQSTVLDGVTGTESVAVVLCERPVPDAWSLVPLARQGEPPEGCVLERYTLIKEPRR